MKITKIIALCLVMMITSVNIVSATNSILEIPTIKSGNPSILAELVLLMKDGINREYIIFKSPFVEDDLQIELTLKNIFLYETEVIEILYINDVPLKNTIYKEYSALIDRTKLPTNEDEYSKGKSHDMLERDPNKPFESRPMEEVTRVAYVLIDGIILDTDVEAYVINGRTMVPFRAISEALNAEVGFNFINDDLRVVWAIRYYTKVDMNIGDHRIFKDGRHIFMDQPAVVREGRTFVPVRYIAELFDCKVQWEDSTSTVYISTGK